jgi:glycosyltransferase involved in cell wall biosynthesis
MKVAFVGDWGHPNGARWVEDLVALCNIEVHAIDFELHRARVEGIVPHVLPSTVPTKVRYLFAGRPLARLLRSIRPDVVVAYRVVSYGFAAARARVRPLVLAGQGQGIVSSESPPGSRYCARYALRRGDLLHAWAPHMARAMEALGAEPERIKVLHRGVRTDIFSGGTCDLRRPVVVSSRQLDPYYRTDVVLDGFALAVSGGLDAELWICGEGPARPSLESRVRDLRLERRVRFLGRVDTERMAEIYRSAAVYASAVPTDGVSSSLLEAMASGLTPVVVDNEANRNWIRESREGFLVTPGDPSAFAQALDQAVRKGLPPEARASNRDRIVAEADRKTNLERIVGWWRELAARQPWAERRANA